MEAGWRREYSRYKGFFLNVSEAYKKRQDFKMFLEIFLSLGAIIIFSVFAIKPTATTIAKLFKDIKTKEDLINQLDTKIVNLNKARNTYTQMQSKINLLEASVPDGPELDEFAKQMESVSTTGPVTISQFGVDEVTLLGKLTQKNTSKDQIKLPEGAVELSFNFGATGEYTQIIDVLKNMENMRRPIIIESINLTRGKSEELSGNLILAVRGRIPYLNNQ